MIEREREREREIDKISYNLGFKDGYFEASKWINVKDKLPVNDRYKTYIVIDKHNCSTIARFDDDKWLSYPVIDNVVLWKELILPKELKEND